MLTAALIPAIVARCTRTADPPPSPADVRPGLRTTHPNRPGPRAGPERRARPDGRVKVPARVLSSAPFSGRPQGPAPTHKAAAPPQRRAPDVRLATAADVHAAHDRGHSGEPATPLYGAPSGRRSAGRRLQLASPAIRRGPPTCSPTPARCHVPGRTYPVTARLLDDRERPIAGTCCSEWFPNWRDYPRSPTAEFRVFELRPVDARTGFDGPAGRPADPRRRPR